MVSSATAITALLLGIGLSTARADMNARCICRSPGGHANFEADLRQVFHWSFPPKARRKPRAHQLPGPDLLAIVLTNPASELVLVRGDDLYIQRDKKAPVKYKLEVRNGKPTQNVQFLLSFVAERLHEFRRAF